MSVDLQPLTTQSEEEIKTTDYCGISEFYAGKCLFVTGVTGFLGKVFIEKLLYSCPDVRKIYIMLRPKRGQSIENRMDALFNCKLFDRLRKDYPNYREKLTFVSGDMFEPNLGISDNDKQELCENVNIVVHSAATVRFDEHLKIAIQMNLEGPKKIALLCAEMKHLEALVHVSSAYSNCDKRRVEEMVYAPSVHPQKLLDAIEWMDDEILDNVTKKLIGPMPNTYTFTKQLAEYYLVNTFPNLPIIIVRPSIVGCAWQEPLPGWVDSFNGPTGILAAIGKGLLRCMVGNRDCRMDIIPVDLVANMILTAAWYQTVYKPNRQPVYNAVLGSGRDFRWKDLEIISTKYFLTHPVNSVLRPPKASFTKSSLWYQISMLFNHRIPAYLMDLWLCAIGKKAIFVQVSKKLKKSTVSLEYFTSHEWDFANTNVRQAIATMSPSDKKVFNCDVTKVNGTLYMENYCLGTKLYALKEDTENVSTAKAHLKKLQRLSLVWNTILCVIIWRIMVKRVPVAHNMWVFMLNLALSLFQKLPRFARS